MTITDNHTARVELARAAVEAAEARAAARVQAAEAQAKEDLDNLLKMIPAIGKSAARALDMAKGTIKYIAMPGIIFEELGLKYLGPIDGHNIGELIEVMASAKRLKGPIFIHVRTQKGKGYRFAENKPQDTRGFHQRHVA